ncbi:hypothetical protein BDN72DRAFT_904171 [Pluteus cervinus]|uniref:Uncharacterized protein n=1 Tax=Pluteus cervinus TaxID=181527 RepID=A0ACD3A7T4_9AGAR|nr:hypothetical protein BDN72DRAFT_904171 [Pluteus cervinus]
MSIDDNHSSLLLPTPVVIFPSGAAYSLDDFIAIQAVQRSTHPNGSILALGHTVSMNYTQYEGRCATRLVPPDILHFLNVLVSTTQEDLLPMSPSHTEHSTASQPLDFDPLPQQITLEQHEEECLPPLNPYCQALFDLGSPEHPAGRSFEDQCPGFGEADEFPSGLWCTEDYLAVPILAGDGVNHLVWQSPPPFPRPGLSSSDSQGGQYPEIYEHEQSGHGRMSLVVDPQEPQTLPQHRLQGDSHQTPSSSPWSCSQMLGSRHYRYPSAVNQLMTNSGDPSRSGSCVNGTSSRHELGGERQLGLGFWMSDLAHTQRGGTRDMDGSPPSISQEVFSGQSNRAMGAHTPQKTASEASGGSRAHSRPQRFLREASWAALSRARHERQMLYNSRQMNPFPRGCTLTNDQGCTDTLVTLQSALPSTSCPTPFPGSAFSDPGQFFIPHDEPVPVPAPAFHW